MRLRLEGAISEHSKRLRSLHAMSLKKKILSGGAWALGGKLVSIVCAVLLNLMLTRGLSPADYGAYFVCLNTVIILVTVGTLGMDQIAIRLVAVATSTGNRTLVRKIALRCLGIVTVAAAIVTLSLALGSHWLFAQQMKMPQVVASTVVVSLWLFFSTLQRQIAETFRGLSDIRLATVFGGMRNSGFLINTIVCVSTACFTFAGALTLGRVFGIWALGTAVVLLVSLAVLKQKIRSPPGTIERLPDPSNVASVRTGHLLSEGWPLGLSLLVTVLNNQGVGWLAGKFDIPEHVALFGLAQQFVILAITPMVIGNSIVPPIIAELYNRGELTRLERVAQSIAALFSIPSAGLFLLLLFVGHALLGTLFGAFYYNAYPLVLILCAGQVANVATGTWQFVLPMAGQKNQMLLLSLFSASLQVVTGIVGGHYWGVYGVAWAFCLSMVVSNLAGMIVVRRRLGIWTFVWLDRKILVEIVSMVKSKLSRRRAGGDPAECTVPGSKEVL